MPDPHQAAQCLCVFGRKHIFDQTVGLAFPEEVIVVGDNTRGVLPPMLEHEQPVI